MTVASATADTDLHTPEEIAKRFKLTVTTVYRKAGRREWPSTKIGRRLFFTDQQVAEIIRISTRPVVEKPRRHA